MRQLSLGQGIWAALKADTFAIAAWQIGMYRIMGSDQLLVLPARFARRADSFSLEFWFMMQLAMVAGFATAYPVNWLLMRRGLKEEM